MLRAGLAFYNLSDGPESVSKRLALLFFILLLFELLPFCYMSFYVADRRFFAADVSNDLYHPSAYYISAVIAGMRMLPKSPASAGANRWDKLVVSLYADISGTQYVPAPFSEYPARSEDGSRYRAIRLDS